MAAESPVITAPPVVDGRPVKRRAGSKLGRSGLAVLGAAAALAGCGSSPSASPVSHETPATGSTAAHNGPTHAAHRSGHSGGLHVEIADNHNGTPLFGSPEGAAVPDGVPGSIKYGTHVLVRCYTPNESDMSSVNDFYLIEGGVNGRLSDIKGAYAPANTFANGGPMGDNPYTLDSHVGKC